MRAAQQRILAIHCARLHCMIPEVPVLCEIALRHCSRRLSHNLFHNTKGDRSNFLLKCFCLSQHSINSIGLCSWCTAGACTVGTSACAVF